MTSKKSTSLAYLKKFIPYVFYSLLLIFLFFYIKSLDFNKLRGASIQWQFVVPAVFLGLVARYFGAYVWFVILRGMGAENISNKFKLTYVYAKSWMGRYIPGTAPWILGRIHFASQHGISKNKLAVSSLLEGGLQIIVTMTLASIILLFDGRLDVIDGSSKLLMGLIVVAGVITVVPAVFNKLMALAYKVFKKKDFSSDHLVNNKTVMSAAGLYLVISVINGFSLFFIAKAVYPDIAFSDAHFVIGAGSLAGAASLLAFFAPSGLGVREGIQLVLLSIIMPSEFALAAVVFTRLCSIGIDLLFWGVSSSMQNLDAK